MLSASQLLPQLVSLPQDHVDDPPDAKERATSLAPSTLEFLRDIVLSG
jgi:hypothetical protein